MQSSLENKERSVELSESLVCECGLNLSEGYGANVFKKMERFCEENGCDYNGLVEKLEGEGKREMRNRINNAVNGEASFWFRNKAMWKWLEEESLDDIFKDVVAGAGIKALYLGVDGGYGPYSLGMLLDRYTKSHGLSVGLEVVGLDTSPNSIFFASAGKYKIGLLDKGLPDSYKEDYFTEDKNFLRINTEAKSLVKFKEGGVYDDYRAYKNVNLIVVGKAMSYYTKDFQRDIFLRLKESLDEGGVMVFEQPAEGFEGVEESLVVHERRYAYFKKGRK